MFLAILLGPTADAVCPDIDDIDIVGFFHHFGDTAVFCNNVSVCQYQKRNIDGTRGDNRSEYPDTYLNNSIFGGAHFL